MVPRLTNDNEKRSTRYWFVYGLLLLISSFLALGSGYMAYQVTQEKSVTVGFAGIGFYVIYYLGSSFFLERTK